MNYKETKKLCDEILAIETNKDNLDIQTYTFNKINYYNSFYFKNSILLCILTRNYKDLLTFIQLPISIKGGYIEDDKTLILFLKDSPIFFFNNNDIVKTLHVLYHELYHVKDFSYIPTIMDYNKFSSYIDRYILDIIPNKLSKYNKSKKFHNSFMFEILANLYSMMKIEKFIKNNPDKYNYNREYLYKNIQKYQQQYINYNLTEHIDIILDNYNLFINRKDFNRTIFDIFINENGTFKDIYSVINNPLIHNIDKRIIYSFFKTQLFNKTINVNDLHYEEYNFVKEILSIKEQAKQKKIHK